MNDVTERPSHGPYQTADLLDGYWVVRDMTEAELAVVFPPLPPLPEPDPADMVRADRNALLASSDWTQLPDAPVDQTAWATYRQALRDVTAQAGFPADINWPVAPE